MLTTRQIKKFSELFFHIPDIKSNRIIDYKLRLCYLKDNTVYRLGYLRDFSLLLTQQQFQDLDDIAAKALIPEADWESFTKFVNNTENLNTNMVIPDSHDFLKIYKHYNLGTYTLLNNGVIEGVDFRLMSKLYLKQ